jgi:hypothetical protein
VIPVPIGEFGFVQTRDPRTSNARITTASISRHLFSWSLCLPAAGRAFAAQRTKKSGRQKIGAALGRPDVRFGLVAFVWRSN